MFVEDDLAAHSLPPQLLLTSVFTAVIRSVFFDLDRQLLAKHQLPWQYNYTINNIQ